MRAGSRSSTDAKPGFSNINAQTSAVKPITMRINPGMPRKPKRRSSLSSQVIVAKVTHQSLTSILSLSKGRGRLAIAFIHRGTRVRLSFLSSSIEERMKVRSRNRADLSISHALAPLSSESKLGRMTEVAPRKTPLYDEHVLLGAKMVPFAGWLMPVQYTSIVEEH